MAWERELVGRGRVERDVLHHSNYFFLEVEGGVERDVLHHSSYFFLEVCQQVFVLYHVDGELLDRKRFHVLFHEIHWNIGCSQSQQRHNPVSLKNNSESPKDSPESPKDSSESPKDSSESLKDSSESLKDSSESLDYSSESLKDSSEILIEILQNIESHNLKGLEWEPLHQRLDLERLE